MSNTDDSCSAWSAASTASGSGQGAGLTPSHVMVDEHSSGSSSTSTALFDPASGTVTIPGSAPTGGVSSQGYPCPECWSIFSSKKALRSHKASVHPKSTSPGSGISCEVCHLGFPSCSLLKRHHIVTPECRTHRCMDCPKTFTSAFQLSVHTRRVHLKERSNKCPHCDRTFFKVSDLRAHMNVHMGVKKVCDICGKEFHHVSNLTRHRNAHLAIKPYVCKYCGKRFGQVNLLRYHKASHESSKPFACLYCDASFNSKTPLEKHVRVQHAEEKSKLSSQVRQYYCCVCGQSFGLCDEHRTHEKEHEDRSELTCTECHRTYTELERFRIHSCDPEADLNDGVDPSIASQLLQPEEESLMSADGDTSTEAGGMDHDGVMHQMQVQNAPHGLVGSAYDGISRYVNIDGIDHTSNPQISAPGTTNMVIYVPTNPDGTPDVAAALEAVTGMPAAMGLPPGSTLLQSGDDYVVTLAYDPQAVSSAAATGGTYTTTTVAGGSDGSQHYQQITIPDQLQLPASMIMQSGGHTVPVSVPMSIGEGQRSVAVGSDGRLVEVNGEDLMDVDGSQHGNLNSQGARYVTSNGGSDVVLSRRSTGMDAPVDTGVNGNVALKTEERQLSHNDYDAEQKHIPEQLTATETMYVQLGPDGQPMMTTVGEHGSSLMQLIEGTGVDGQEVRYCVVLDPSSFQTDPSGQPTAITLPDGSIGFINPLPPASATATASSDGSYHLRMYDDNSGVAMTVAPGILGDDLFDPELFLTEEDLRELMCDGDTFDDEPITTEELVKIRATIDRVVADGKNNNANEETETNGQGPRKLLECQFCGKKFGRKYTFKQHLGIHDASLHMYRCELCNKSFAYKTTLKKHHLAVHQGHPLDTLSQSQSTAALNGLVPDYHVEDVPDPEDLESKTEIEEAEERALKAMTEAAMASTSKSMTLQPDRVPDSWIAMDTGSVRGVANESVYLHQCDESAEVTQRDSIVGSVPMASAAQSYTVMTTLPDTAALEGSPVPTQLVNKVLPATSAVRERNHKCDTCPKAFFKKHDLMVHQRSHTKDFPYECPTCGVRFNHSSHVKRHEKSCPVLKRRRMEEEAATLAGASSDEAVVASSPSLHRTRIGGYSLPDATTVTITPRRHEPEPDRGVNTLSPDCIICLSTFADLTSLYNHMKIEHGITVEHTAPDPEPAPEIKPIIEVIPRKVESGPVHVSPNVVVVRQHPKPPDLNPIHLPTAAPPTPRMLVSTTSAPSPPPSLPSPHITRTTVLSTLQVPKDYSALKDHAEDESRPMVPQKRPNDRNPENMIQEFPAPKRLKTVSDDGPVLVETRKGTAPIEVPNAVAAAALSAAMQMDMPQPLFVTQKRVKSVSAGVQSDLGEYSVLQVLNAEAGAQRVANNALNAKSRVQVCSMTSSATSTSSPTPSQARSRPCCCRNKNGDCRPLCVITGAVEECPSSSSSDVTVANSKVRVRADRKFDVSATPPPTVTKTRITTITAVS